VFCYFDTDVKFHAPLEAAHFAARLRSRPASMRSSAS